MTHDASLFGSGTPPLPLPPHGGNAVDVGGAALDMVMNPVNVGVAVSSGGNADASGIVAGAMIADVAKRCCYSTGEKMSMRW